MKIRVGFGFDVHQLREGLKLLLGGISIPHDKGAVGHSDADALIHAICDALLGAAALGDIGTHFPDTSPEYKDIDSKVLLEKVAGKLTEKGCKVQNIDCTVCLEQPKIGRYIPDMRNAISDVLGINPDDISIKATTNERMGFIGREEGVAAYAVALVQQS